MTAEEAARAHGDEPEYLSIGPTPDRPVSARPARVVVVSIVVAWAAVSMGFVGALWLLGAKGAAPLRWSPDAWESRGNLDVDALPGAGLLTRISVLGFPLHWAVVAIGCIAAFIGLALLYNMHADARVERARDMMGPNGSEV